MFIPKIATSDEYLFLLSLSTSSTHICVVHNVSTRNINPAQALIFFEHFHLRHSYGKTIFHSCRNSVAEHIDTAKNKQHKKHSNALPILLIVIMNLQKIIYEITES